MTDQSSQPPRPTSASAPCCATLRSCVSWVGVIALAIGLCTFMIYRGPSAQPVQAADSQIATQQFDQAIKSMARPAATPIPANASPKTLGQLAELCRVLADYRQKYGEYPIGSNTEIAAALMGKNPANVRYLDPGDVTTDTAGRFIDSWQTPYFFHQLSGTSMEIRSAGPDRQMWTADDLIVHPR